ncbi:TPA: hypothetical protein ACNUWL_004029, partial [Aeromonas salmonicida subsp. salmonicida]
MPHLDLQAFKQPSQEGISCAADTNLPKDAAFMWGRAHYPHPGKWLGSGNRCGHKPSSPAWHLFKAPETKKPLPYFIQELIERVRHYYAQPTLLPTLANLSGKVNKLSGKPRQNRSEAREAECLVLEAILSRTDFASLRVGTPLPDGRFIHRTMVEIATIAGMVEDAIDKETKQLVNRPTQRFWRAIRRLKVGGAIDIHKQYETLEDGTIRARPGIKTVNMHFIVALGRISYEKLKAFRTHCSKALKRDSDSHKQQFPDMHDPEIANRRLRDLQREKGIKTNPPSSTDKSPV